jgi:hypothetical protein
LNNLEPMMPGTKIKGAFLTLFNVSMISGSLEILSGIFAINRVIYLGFEHLLPERIYQYFSAFRHLSIQFSLSLRFQVFNLMRPIILSYQPIGKSRGEGSRYSGDIIPNL